METPPNPIYTKEMVDLLIRVKKHLLNHQQVAIRLSDPSLFDKLVKIHPKDDPLLLGMIQYLMALGGPEWTQIYNSQGAAGDAPGQSTASADHGARGLLKRGASLYRGMINGHHHDGPASADVGERPAPPPPAEPEATEQRKPVRYYRGQPVYDD
jgi:hypothetical protein